MEERQECLGESKDFKFTDYGEGRKPIDAINRKKTDKLRVQVTRWWGSKEGKQKHWT